MCYYLNGDNMKCDNCGFNITEGTLCPRCEYENDDEKREKALEEKEERRKKYLPQKPKKNNQTLKLLLAWMIFMGILSLVYHLMDSSFQACVKENGHSECGLGTLCDNKCMPPFYFLISMAHTALSMISLILVPAGLIIVISEDKNNKKQQ